MENFNLKRDKKHVTAARTSAGLAESRYNKLAKGGSPRNARRLVGLLGNVATSNLKKQKKRLPVWLIKLIPKSYWQRAYASLTLLLFIVSLIATTLQPFHEIKPYKINDAARSILPRQSDTFAGLLKYDQKAGTYEYNQSFTGTFSAENGNNGTGTPRINATIHSDAAKGVTVKDPQEGISLTLKPKFQLLTARQDKNQIVYPLGGGSGYLIYTTQITGVKEDILLGKPGKDKMVFNYEIADLHSGLEPRLEPNGAIGVYGSDMPINGDVATGSEKDKELLEKARQNNSKNKLFFTIPAPVVVEYNKTVSDVKTYFQLEGNTVRLVAEKLKAASYPLSIDPSIYVETAQRLMRGNNETNLDFDITNELIQKGKLTGARFNSWNSTLALPGARHGHGTAVYGGYIYTVGGNSSSGGGTSQRTVYWAKLNTTTGAIEAPNPGTGACASWCTNTAYDIPAARDGMSLVAYNGYLYVMGGMNTASPQVPQSSVYIAKLGINGEPSLWHPTNTDKSTWTYWHTPATGLSGARAYAGAAAYNSRMYLIGGQTTAGGAPVTTVETATIDPQGTISAFSTTGMVALASGQQRLGHNVQIYNDRVYVIGGASSVTVVTNTILYMKLNSDGTMAGTAWASTTAPLDTAGTAAVNRMSLGGSFSTIWGGYIYIAGGCSGISVASSVTSCATAVHNSVQIASLNADGTLSDWQTIGSTVETSRTNYGLVSWRGTLYGIGGCTTLTCSSSVTAATSYGVINQDGDASTVNSSSAKDTGECTAANNYKYCDLPPQGDSDEQGGRLAGGSVINNGFIYYIGGCTQVNANSICFTGNSGRVTDNISYAQITPDGTARRVPTSACTSRGANYDYYGSWCVLNPSGSNGINAGTGIAAFGTAVFNNTIYVVGGTTGTLWHSKIWRNTPNSDGSITTSWNSTNAQDFSAIGITNNVSTPAQTTPNVARGYSYVFSRANPSAASSNPGNLYILGGCTGSGGALNNGLNCSAQFTHVYKCNIATDGSLNGCSESGQLEIDSEPGTAGLQGLGVMAGAMYANYIYLVSGQSPNETDRGQIIYAKLDNSNNIVAVPGESSWKTSPNSVSPIRRRGVAFGYNGYLYALAGYAAGTSLNDLLYAKINTSDGSIGAFQTSNVTVDARWDLRAVVNNGYVYTLAGCNTGAPPANCTAMTGGVQIFQLYNNYSGSPHKYEYQNTGSPTYPGGSNNSFEDNRLGHGSAVLNGYLYVVGGCTGLGDCSAVSDKVSYAKMDAFGYLGAWTNSGALSGWKLPAGRGWGQLEAAGGTLYYLGGQDTIGASSTVYWATPNVTTGAITAWAATTLGLGQEDPATGGGNAGAKVRTKFGATVWNNRIYIVGGNTNLNDSTAQDSVLISADLTTGGDIDVGGLRYWTENPTVFNIPRSGATAITYANNLYILGGATTGSVILSDVQYGKITESGGSVSVGGWSYTSNLPDKLFGADGFAYNGFMYLFGGKASSDVCETNTIAAPISANTTIASGNNPTGIGEWFETNEKYIGSRYGSSAAYYDGKAYVTGGACNSTLTYVPTANKLAQTTLLSQPQIARYSRLIDTDTDVFPKNWLLNGLDNSIGARWRATYRSMHDIDVAPHVSPTEDCGTSGSMSQMTTWGQETNVGNVILGKIEPYTAKNSSGGNINCARYFFFTFTIDSSQAYGYPEDVTRGPTIADLTLFFTADPSKRLRHGKTFTGGEQMPLNTPCRDADPNPPPADINPNDDNC